MSFGVAAPKDRPFPELLEVVAVQLDQASAGPGMLSLLQDLIRQPTTRDDGAVNNALAVLRDYLERAGVHMQIISSPAISSPLARAVINGNAPGPAILLQGHLDVVPADVGWSSDPFSGEFKAGFVYGRGAVDMKGGVTAFAAAMADIRARGLPCGSVTLLVDTDEETGSDHGLIPYIATQGLAGYDWAICGEPTGLRPYLGNRGLIWATIEVLGEASHAGMPYAGRNPLPVAARILGALPAPSGRAGPYGGAAPSLTPTTLHAGTVVNAIPGNAVLTMDRRLLPGDDPAEVAEQLRVAVQDVAGADGFEVRFRVTKSWPPCLLAEDTRLARTAREITQRRGHDPSFGFDDACNDASFLSEAGVPTLIWGPGDPQLAHSSREFVALADVEAAAAMYAEAVLTLTVEERDDG
jgi:succinyl-diaminopimelate desuccinylase